MIARMIKSKANNNIFFWLWLKFVAFRDLNFIDYSDIS